MISGTMKRLVFLSLMVLLIGPTYAGDLGTVYVENEWLWHHEPYGEDLWSLWYGGVAYNNSPVIVWDQPVLFVVEESGQTMSYVGSWIPMFQGPAASPVGSVSPFSYGYFEIYTEWFPGDDPPNVVHYMKFDAMDWK